MATLPGILQNQPENINFLATHRFRVVLRRAPSVVYFVQECNLPGMTMNNPKQPTPFVDMPVPGDKIEYGEFVMSFSVDEDMKNYKEIAAWMTGLGFPKQFEQYKNLYESADGIESDITLYILDSALQPQHMVRFYNAFPVGISDLKFDTKASDTQQNMVTATFKYSYWQFEEVNEDLPLTSEADLR